MLRVAGWGLVLIATACSGDHARFIKQHVTAPDAGSTTDAEKKPSKPRRDHGEAGADSVDASISDSESGGGKHPKPPEADAGEASESDDERSVASASDHSEPTSNDETEPTPESSSDASTLPLASDTAPTESTVPGEPTGPFMGPGGASGAGGMPPAVGTGGAGGMPSVAGTGGAGGMPSVAGTGGMAPVANTGGAGGMQAAGPIDPATFAPEIDGYFWEATCVGGGADGRQCSLSPNFDPNNIGECTVNLDKSMTVNGDANTKYVMDIDVRGMLGSRCYTGGTRRAGAAPVNWTGPNDGLYVGGTAPANWWNSHEIHVAGAPAQEPSVFYLNAYYDNPDPTISFDSTTCTMDEVLEVNYTFEVAVMGNSTLLFRISDTNCQAQMNCGAYNGVKECPTPREVDLAGMDPPATFEQPPSNAVGANVFYPQWAYFDVKSVRVAQ